MSRKRMLDTDRLFGDTEMWATIKERGILFYQLLWGLATDYGILEVDEEQLSTASKELRFTPAEVEEWIRIQVGRRKIILFRSGDTNKTYMHILAFMRHQVFHTPGRPTTPLPPWILVEQTTKGVRKCFRYTILPERLPESYRPKIEMAQVEIFEVDTTARSSMEQHGAATCSMEQHGAACDCAEQQRAASSSSSSSSSISRFSRPSRVLSSNPPLTPPAPGAVGELGDGKERSQIEGPAARFDRLLTKYPGAIVLSRQAYQAAFKAYVQITSNGTTHQVLEDAIVAYAAECRRTHKKVARIQRWLANDFRAYVGSEGKATGRIQDLARKGKKEGSSCQKKS